MTVRQLLLLLSELPPGWQDTEVVVEGVTRAEHGWLVSIEAQAFGPGVSIRLLGPATSGSRPVWDWPTVPTAGGR
jgi:hypothetical protein